MSVASYYPPSPPDVPVDLTAPTSAYRQQAALVLISVFIFLLLYFGLLFLSGLLIYKLIAWPLPPVRGGGVLFLRILFIIPCALLFLFLCKNLFKFNKPEKSYDIEIFEDDHPRLFDFIDRLCEETGAEHPHRVLVRFEVNAFVGYKRSLFHLFWPAKKELIVGLGLVNAINLTEFKAVLAHEFGHITQKTMKLGSYAYYALGIIHDMVYGYDFFDRMLEHWRLLHPAISWPAWTCFGILWLFRKLLAGMFLGIVFLERALSRQMEFNADLMAVSVTGSDAPVHLLRKSWFGDICLQQVIEELHVARDHELLTSDLFYHLDKAADYVRRKAKNPQLGVPPRLPDDPSQRTQVFKHEEIESEEEEQAAMWDTHPPNFDREENAKYDYIRSTFDERTAWILFDNVDELRERVTIKFYRQVFRTKRELLVSEAEQVQKFIDEEHAETTYDPRYQGLYDARNLFATAIQERADSAKSRARDLATLGQIYSGLYGVEVKHRAQLHNHRRDEFNLVLAVVNRWHRPKNGEFEFRGDWYEVREAKRLLKKLEKEYEKDEDWLRELDNKVFEVCYDMAVQLNPIWTTELFRRYEFHLALQKVWKRLHDQEGPLNFALDFLRESASTTLHEADFNEIIRIFREAHHELRDALRACEDLYFPPLANMPAGQPVRPFLLSKKLVSGLSRWEYSLPAKWIEKFLKQHSEVLNRINRLHFKSMGAILALQETIAAEALRRTASGRPPTAPSGPPVLRQG